MHSPSPILCNILYIFECAHNTCSIVRLDGEGVLGMFAFLLTLWAPLNPISLFSLLLLSSFQYLLEIRSRSLSAMELTLSLASVSSFAALRTSSELWRTLRNPLKSLRRQYLWDLLLSGQTCMTSSFLFLPPSVSFSLLHCSTSPYLLIPLNSF